MKYYFCELSKNEKLTQEDIDCIETWADFEFESDEKDEAIDAYSDWLDENNYCKNSEDEYNCAIVDENKMVQYFFVIGQMSRNVTWGWKE